MKKEKKEKKEPAIKSLHDLEEICREVIEFKTRINGKEVTIPVRRLLPAEEEQINRIMQKALPPSVPGKPEELDFRDPKYHEEKDRNQRQAKALAVYWCCELFSKEKPDLKTAEEITAFVYGSKLTLDVLEGIFSVAQSGTAELAKFLNFT